MAFVKDHPFFKDENQKEFILDKEELHEVIQKCSEGDEKAIERMILSNLRLVIKIVSKYAYSPEDYQDMISVGTQALTRAVKKLNPERIPTLRTYLSIAVKNGVIDYLNKEQKTVRGKGNHDVKIHSLNTPAHSGDENSQEEQVDLLESSIPNPFESLELKNDIEKLNKLIGYLDQREQKIVKMYYGIGENKKTLEVIGEEFNISKVRASQINKEAIVKMRTRSIDLETTRKINQEYYFNGKTS